MKKWYLIIIGIIAIAATAGIIKILSYTSELEKSLSSEHSLNEKNLIISKESSSPDNMYKYYEYQFDNGGLGYSRLFWSVIKNDNKEHNLENGILPNGYKVIGWTENNELILEKWAPYYDSQPKYILENKSKHKGIKINIVE